jgi:hypothetical protein
MSKFIHPLSQDGILPVGYTGTIFFYSKLQVAMPLSNQNLNQYIRDRRAVYA